MAEQEWQSRSRQILSGEQIFFLNANFIGSIGGNHFDIPFQLPFPCNTFFIASVNQGRENNTLAMSLIPTGLPTGTPFTTLKGTEQIFYLTGPITNYRSVIRFKEAIFPLIYLSFGTETGLPGQYTIGCVRGKQFYLRGGCYT